MFILLHCGKCSTFPDTSSPILYCCPIWCCEINVAIFEQRKNFCTWNKTPKISRATFLHKHSVQTLKHGRGGLIVLQPHDLEYLWYSPLVYPVVLNIRWSISHYAFFNFCKKRFLLIICRKCKTYNIFHILITNDKTYKYISKLIEMFACIQK